MQESSNIAAAFAVALCLFLSGCDRASTPSAPATPPDSAQAREEVGAPGTTDPLEIIEARRLLMAEAERQIKPIDLYTLGNPADSAAMRAAALTIETVLIALPHLFPQSTNLFDSGTREPPTITLPAVWQNWGSFEQLAVNAERAAAALVAADGDAALMSAAKGLRASCDACHQAFTKPYVPPQATEEDRNFDFESFLPPQ
jgi:cytochrome c556